MWWHCICIAARLRTRLSDEDLEQDPERWASHAATGQECWQVVSQWVWNLRLELGHALDPEALRTTEFAPALLPAQKEAADFPSFPLGYGPAEQALPWKHSRFSGRDFPPSRMERCAVLPGSRSSRKSGAEKPMGACAWSMRPASAGVAPVPCVNSVNGMAVLLPSRAFVSVLLHPLVVGSAPLLWKDWSRRQHRRACKQGLGSQRVEVQVKPTDSPSPPEQKAVILSRAQRAHYRLTWAERLARHVRPLTAGRVTIRLFGVPERFATSLGLATV